MDAEKMSAIDSLLAQLDQPDHTHVWSRDDVLNARAELASLRAELNDAQVQEYMSRCRGDVLAEINDALRAELESLRAEQVI